MKNLNALWKHTISFTRQKLHHHPLVKFLIVLFVFLAYTLFTSMKFGAREGFVVSALTWSFFVLCTPIADAGFLLDLPLRLITGMRMVVGEVVVWIIAIRNNRAVPHPLGRGCSSCNSRLFVS